MSKKQDLKPIIKIIHKAAQAYKDNLVGKDFLYIFDDRCIEAKFRVDNFMHFTGVESNLSARRFYQNALNNKLSPSQIFFSKKHPFNLAQKKWNYICNIPTVLTDECFMLEKITTQTASYEFGATNVDCTICLNKELVNGVAKGKHYIAMTLRDEDCFNRSQNQYIVTHIFSKPNNQSKYDTLQYIDRSSSANNLPESAKQMLSEDLLNNLVEATEKLPIYLKVNEKISAIISQNAEVAELYRQAEEKYFLSHPDLQKAPIYNPSASLLEKYKAAKAFRDEHNDIVKSDPQLKEAYIKAKSEYEQVHQPQSRQAEPKPKHRK